MRLENKTALITGGATGIGRAIALRFAAEGANVLIADINEPGGQQTADDAGGRFIRCDVSSSWDCDNAVGAARDWFGGLHILINCAAYLGGYHDVSAMDPTGWREGLSVSLDGVFYASHAAVPLIEQSGGGAIVHIASVEGMMGASNHVAYVTAKSALFGLTRSMAIDLGTRGIRVNAVSPGPIDAGRPEVTKTSGGASRVPAILARHDRARPPRPPGGSRQRGPLPRLRRSELHHRPEPGRRRRLDHRPRADPGHALPAAR